MLSSEFLQKLIKNGEINSFVDLLKEHSNTHEVLDRNTFGECLFHSIEHKQYEIFEALLKLEFSVNEYHDFSFLPLHHAVDTEAGNAHQLGRDPLPLFSKALLRVGANPFFKRQKWKHRRRHRDCI